MTELKHGWCDVFACIGRTVGARASLCVAVTLSVLLPNIAPAAAEPLAIKLVSITSPVHHGDMITLVLQTAAGATCSAIIAVKAFTKEPQDRLPDLSATKADNKGVVSWTWQTTGQAGHRDMTIHCSAGDRKGVLNTSFDVT